MFRSSYLKQIILFSCTKYASGLHPPWTKILSQRATWFLPASPPLPVHTLQTHGPSFRSCSSLRAATPAVFSWNPLSLLTSQLTPPLPSELKHQLLREASLVSALKSLSDRLVLILCRAQFSVFPM